MGLWILEPWRHDVPGTAFMGAGGDKESTITPELDPSLKYDLSGDAPIVLVPQPSDDPNDPLNWPLWERDLITFVLCLVSIMAATLGPMLAPSTFVFAHHFKRSLTEIALLTGYHLCGVGVAGLLFVASARVHGKRHLYLMGTVLLVASSAWGGAASNYQSFLWARIIQGVAVCPFEALVNISVGEMYCVHQRGKRIALANFSLFGGAFLTPVIVGKMTEALGWRWPFFMVAIFSGAMLPMVILWVPETAFRRSAHLNSGRAFASNLGEDGTDSNSTGTSGCNHLSSTQLGSSKVSSGKEVVSSPTTSPDIPKSRDSFVKRMAPFNGRKTEESLIKLFLRPLVLLLHPAVIWGMLTQGALIGWTVMIGVVLAAVFMLPPLSFTEVKTGYMYTGAFFGAFAGFALAGPLADWSAKFLTKRNKGIYEPEFRLFLVIPQMITGCIGLYMFGYTAANTTRFGWFWPDFFFGLEVMGMIIGAVASALYLVEAHRDIAIESFTCLLLFKNFFSFALTWEAFHWVLSLGTRKMFYYIASVQIGVCLLSVPMYIFGKLNRDFMHRVNLLKIMRLDVKEDEEG